jgi:hypothetical protein
MVTDTACRPPSNGEYCGTPVAPLASGCTMGMYTGWGPDAGKLWLCPSSVVATIPSSPPYPSYDGPLVLQNLCSSCVGTPLDSSWAFVVEGAPGSPSGCPGSCGN